MNDPSSSAYNPLTMDQVKDCWVEKEHVPFAALKYTIHCDTAFWYQERQARGDESVITVWGHLPGTGDVYYIEGHGSRVWRSEDFSEKLVQIVQRLRAKRYRISMITDEREMGGKTGAWETLLRNAFHHSNLAMPAFVQLQRSGTAKVARITNAAGYWVDGHVKLIEKAPGVDELVKQMVSIGSGAHDDWADAAADVFHKDVYVPMRRIGRAGGVVETPSYPGDEWLKTGMPTTRDVLKMYDRQNAKAESTPYDTID
jgi:predicted phage terminase large subunit-like protein